MTHTTMHRLALSIAFGIALTLSLLTPASAVTLLTLPITVASGPSVSQTFQLRPGPGGRFLPTTMTIQGTFTYGSGGTSTDAYIQTSIDGGGTWADVANFHFLTA